MNALKSECDALRYTNDDYSRQKADAENELKNMISENGCLKEKISGLDDELNMLYTDKEKQCAMMSEKIINLNKQIRENDCHIKDLTQKITNYEQLDKQLEQKVADIKTLEERQKDFEIKTEN